MKSMIAADLIKILQLRPELPVRIAESKKHDDDVPLLDIVTVEKTENIEDDESPEAEQIIIWVEPNPETISLETKELFEDKIMSLSTKDKDGDTWVEARNVFAIFRKLFKREV